MKRKHDFITSHKIVILKIMRVSYEHNEINK